MRHMDFLNEKRVHYLEKACAHCGSPSPSLRSNDTRLCSICLEERHLHLDDQRVKVRRHFDLLRSPKLRSCFLKLLLSHGVDLEPSGWRTGLALGYELKDAGFAAQEAKQILVTAGADAESVRGLVDAIYQKKGMGPLTCEQIRGLNVVCNGCIDQFNIALSEHRTIIMVNPEKDVRKEELINPG